MKFLVAFGLSAAAAMAMASGRDQALGWPQVLGRHEMVFRQLPADWTEAPHFGNAMLGSMLYQDGNAIKLQVFRADVHDHRDQSHGWTAYSRPRLRIGHFLLHPVGKLTGCRWRKDLWNAELTGVIEPDRGEIRLHHLVHAEAHGHHDRADPDGWRAGMPHLVEGMRSAQDRRSADPAVEGGHRALARLPGR